jgi:hypothetical protein
MRTVLKEVIKVLDGISGLQHFFYSEFYEEGQKEIDLKLDRGTGEDEFNNAWKLIKEFLDDVIDDLEDDGELGINFRTNWLTTINLNDENDEWEIEEGLYGEVIIFSKDPSYLHYPKTTAIIKLVKIRNSYDEIFYRTYFSVYNYEDVGYYTMKDIGYERSGDFQSFKEAYIFLYQAIRDFDKRVFFGKKEAIDWTTLIDGQ